MNQAGFKQTAALSAAEADSVGAGLALELLEVGLEKNDQRLECWVEDELELHQPVAAVAPDVRLVPLGSLSPQH